MLKIVINATNRYRKYIPFVSDVALCTVQIYQCKMIRARCEISIEIDEHVDSYFETDIQRSYRVT